MAKIPRHPKKPVQIQVEYALSHGWRLETRSGHLWGHLLCPHAARDGCKVRVSSTPRNPDNAARGIRHEIDACPHQDEWT